MKRIPPFRRRGSALIMVLGMLAVLTLMAVVFSTFVRTERSGTTNLKNGVVARNSLYSALGRVIEAIDLSFDASAVSTGDDFSKRYWPAAVWPQPWLASSNYPDDDNLISEVRGWLDPHLDEYFDDLDKPVGKRTILNDKVWDDLAKKEDRKTARILTDEIAKHLSPSQLALARSAKCKWAPLRGSINATTNIPPGNDDFGGLLEQVGRPAGDDLIGRYAFIVLDTTGLADMNVVGLNDDDRDPTDPTTFVLPVSSAAKPSGVRDDVGNQSVKSFVKKLDTFNDNRFYSSLADARAAFSTSLDSVFNYGPFNKNEILPADLFAGFSPSLQELNPAGLPKIYLPTQTEFDDYDVPAVKNFFGRVFGAMIAVFARSRATDPNGSPTDYAKDRMTIFQNTSVQYGLNRSALAAVAIVDGVDGDNQPGGTPDVNCWKLFATDEVSAPHKVKGTTPSETVLSGVTDEAVRNNYLNFPCTESAFLLDSVSAWITWDQPGFADPTDETDEETYTGTIHVRAQVQCLNTTDGANRHAPRVKLEWSALPGEPQSGTASAPDNDEIRMGNLEFQDKIDWSDFFDQFQNVSEAPEAGNEFDDDGRVNPSAFVVESERTFGVRVNACAKVDPNTGDFVYKWYPSTRAEFDLDPEFEEYGPGGNHPSGSSPPQDVSIPICVKVTVEDRKGNVWTPVQQAPAPALEDAASGSWWIRVNPCVYHGPDSTFGGRGDPWGDPAGGGGNAGGWAFCMAPAFAFDTTSLREPNGENEVNFWISDLVSRDGGGGGGGWGAGSSNADPELEALLWGDGNNNFAGFFASGNQGWSGEGAGSLLYDWFAEYDTVGADPVQKWLNNETASFKFAPDFLHSSGSGRRVFHKESGQTLSFSELYSRIPAKGYRHPADLGGVMCGPFETLSLFKTWRKTDKGGVDFHPVLDYFAPESDRYPSTNDLRRFVRNDVGSGDFGFDRTKGDMKWEKLNDDDLFSALHNGRVNLNAPPLVKATQVSQLGDALRGERSSRRNPFPIATVFNGANVFSKRVQGAPKPRWIGEDEAFKLAFDVCRMLQQADESRTNDVAFSYPVSKRFSFPRRTTTNGVVAYPMHYVRRPLVKNISFLGEGMEDDNPLLQDFVTTTLQGSGQDFRKPENDADRESLLRSTMDGFCTRGQTFLAIIRADAYSPKYGENESAEDGATLATTHALVELFRDPVPARAPDGSLPVDKSGRPILYHNWYIRSFRVF